MSDLPAANPQPPRAASRPRFNLGLAAHDQIHNHPARSLLLSAAGIAGAATLAVPAQQALEDMQYPVEVRQAWTDALMRGGMTITIYDKVGQRVEGERLKDVLAQAEKTGVGQLYVRFSSANDIKLCTTVIPTRMLQNIVDEYPKRIIISTPSEEEWSAVCKLSPEELQEARANQQRWRYLDRNSESAGEMLDPSETFRQAGWTHAQPYPNVTTRVHYGPIQIQPEMPSAQKS